ncbi:MAG TPA: HD domain-containing phosphohydrolase [Desulfomonilaceae bacterium]|nr:HD domain-containing phosphohydrolase [Desulfomonilaceae bacterium]
MNTNKNARILIVDDEPYICELLARWITSEGHRCVVTFSAEAALEILDGQSFELVITDIMMPGMSGLDLLATIKKAHPDTAVIMVTAVDDRKTGVLALELGAFGYVIKPFEKNEVLINVSNALQRRQFTLLYRQYDRNLSEHVDRQSEHVRQGEQILLKMIAEAGRRHGETEAHLLRVGRCSSLLADALAAGWTMKQCQDISLAAALHDIGKIGIPDSILMKPGNLTHEEITIMQTHTVLAEKLLGISDSSALVMGRSVALYHHENWDGSGYPKGLTGEAIPQEARITAVCDTYDALTRKRSYRDAWTEEDALAIMVEQKGKRFEPKILDVFFDVLPAIRQLFTELHDEDWG